MPVKPQHLCVVLDFAPFALLSNKVFRNLIRTIGRNIGIDQILLGRIVLADPKAGWPTPIMKIHIFFRLDISLIEVIASYSAVFPSEYLRLILLSIGLFLPIEIKAVVVLEKVCEVDPLVYRNRKPLIDCIHSRLIERVTLIISKGLVVVESPINMGSIARTYLGRVFEQHRVAVKADLLVLGQEFVRVELSNIAPYEIDIAVAPKIIPL